MDCKHLTTIPHVYSRHLVTENARVNWKKGMSHWDLQSIISPWTLLRASVFVLPDIWGKATYQYYFTARLYRYSFSDQKLKLRQKIYEATLTDWRHFTSYIFILLICLHACMLACLHALNGEKPGATFILQEWQHPPNYCRLISSITSSRMLQYTA